MNDLASFATLVALRLVQAGILIMAIGVMVEGFAK